MKAQNVPVLCFTVVLNVIVAGLRHQVSHRTLIHVSRHKSNWQL